jgi:hypothetical protein
LRTLNLKDGQFTRAMTLASSGLRLRLRYLEDIAIHVGMFKQRTPGPKPHGYCRLDLTDRRQFILALELAGMTAVAASDRAIERPSDNLIVAHPKAKLPQAAS